MDFIAMFSKLFGSIQEFINDCTDIFLFIPKFCADIISILPNDIQFLFGSIIAIICVAYIYRFIR